VPLGESQQREMQRFRCISIWQSTQDSALHKSSQQILFGDVTNSAPILSNFYSARVFYLSSCRVRCNTFLETFPRVWTGPSGNYLVSFRQHSWQELHTPKYHINTPSSSGIHTPDVDDTQRRDDLSPIMTMTGSRQVRWIVSDKRPAGKWVAIVNM